MNAVFVLPDGRVEQREISGDPPRYIEEIIRRPLTKWSSSAPAFIRPAVRTYTLVNYMVRDKRPIYCAPEFEVKEYQGEVVASLRDVQVATQQLRKDMDWTVKNEIPVSTLLDEGTALVRHASTMTVTVRLRALYVVRKA